jgi:uncharacterized membrane protein YccC
MSYTTALSSSRHAGVPLTSWAFAIRVWIAVVAALYAAFWLQLEAASSAGVCVAILAVPTRGQALEKAGFRFLATVIGVAVSIVLIGAFSQTRNLLLLAFAVWIALCIYAAGVSDGNRAYAAVLSGYTVAIVAIEQIDAPKNVFDSGMARGAAIIVGIAAVAVVNDLLAAPNRHHGLANQLAALHRRVRRYARTIIRRETNDPSLVIGLLREVATLRSDIASLATESSSGAIRSAAARNAAVALVAEIHAIRLLRVNQVSSEWLRRDGQVCANLAALISGTRSQQTWRTPLYRCHRAAAEAGVRAFAWLVMASIFFVLAGWSAAATSLTMIAVVVGLGATSPNPKGFTIMALIAGPIATLLAGVLEFLLLDGATQFELLALGIAPFVIGAAVLTTLPNQVLAALGRLLLIFVLVIVGPSNPQTYNPQTYLDVSLFVCLGAALLLAAQTVIPPVSDEHRRQWLMAAARRELERRPSWLSRRYSPEEAMFRDAVRIGQIAATGAPAAALEEVLSLFDEAGLTRLEVKP